MVSQGSIRYCAWMDKPNSGMNSSTTFEYIYRCGQGCNTVTRNIGSITVFFESISDIFISTRWSCSLYQSSYSASLDQAFTCRKVSTYKCLRLIPSNTFLIKNRCRSSLLQQPTFTRALNIYTANTT